MKSLIKILQNDIIETGTLWHHMGIGFDVVYVVSIVQDDNRIRYNHDEHPTVHNWTSREQFRKVFIVSTIPATVRKNK